MLIIALADESKVARLVTEVREKYPKVCILVRAKNYGHRFELLKLGIEAEDMVHEQVHSGLALATRALQALGKPAAAMEEAASKWQRYDDETMDLIVPVQDDFDTYASIVRERRIQLTQLFEKDRAEVEK
jgi:CPA2 family monovalent cation:H+ antiporter-2